MGEPLNGVEARGGHPCGRLADRRAKRTETSSPEVFDDDPRMETGSDDDSVPKPAPVHAGFTMEQAHVHFNAAMAEEQLAPVPMSLFWQA